jgi:hypothetical protein
MSAPHAPLRPDFPLRLPTVIQNLDRVHKRWIVLKVMHGRPRRPPDLDYEVRHILGFVAYLVQCELGLGRQVPPLSCEEGHQFTHCPESVHH